MSIYDIRNQIREEYELGCMTIKQLAQKYGQLERVIANAVKMWRGG